MLADYQVQVADLIRDDSGQITAEARDRAIAAAIERLSEEMPRTLTVEAANQSGQQLDVPAGWVPGESRLDQIEYPVGDVPPTYLDATRVMVLRQPGGAEKIGLADALPPGSTIRVSFTAPHVVDSQSDTVPASRRWGVSCLAASILAGQLASFYANQANSTIAADAVEHRSKSELWAARERQYERQAYIAWGLPLPSANAGAASAQGQAAGVIKSFEPRRGRRSALW